MIELGAALGLGQTILGGISSLFGGNSARDEQRKLERIAARSPQKKASPELGDYYQQATNRYNENPFTTPYYLETVKQADRAAANALGAMQTRGAAIGSIGKINQILADTKGRGIAGAMQNKNAQFSQLGQAAQAKAREESDLFNVNQQAPYERMLQLQQMKSAAANERYNASLGTAMQGLGNLSQYYTAKQYYNPKTNIETSTSNNPLVSYKTPASTNWGTKTYDFVTPSASANPSAAYTNYMDFSNNPLKGRYTSPNTYKPYGSGF